LRNLNAKMPGAILIPLSRKEMAGRESHAPAHGAAPHGETSHSDPAADSHGHQK
jgi:hypothetical protein